MLDQVASVLKKGSGLGKAKLKQAGNRVKRQLAAVPLPNSSSSASDSIAVIRITCPGGCVVDSIYHSGDSCSAGIKTTDKQVSMWLAAGEARFDAKMVDTFGNFEDFTTAGVH